MISANEDYVALRDRLQHKAAMWIAQGGELAERGWWLFELLARIDAMPDRPVEGSREAQRQ